MEGKTRTRTSPLSLGPRPADSGWTFVETLIVLGIVLLLTAGTGLMAARYLDRARIVSARGQLQAFCMALDAYAMDCGSPPSEAQGLEALRRKPAGAPSWKGPYLDREIPADPWSNPYRYRVPGPEGLPFAILSFGADGREGGDGMDADIASWL